MDKKKDVVLIFLPSTYLQLTLKDLDTRCEELIKDEFKETCDFDVEDAVQKLEKLGIVTKVSSISSAKNQ